LSGHLHTLVFGEAEPSRQTVESRLEFEFRHTRLLSRSGGAEAWDCVEQGSDALRVSQPLAGL
jgi:hypothetical protein